MPLRLPRLKPSAKPDRSGGYTLHQDSHSIFFMNFKRESDLSHLFFHYRRVENWGAMETSEKDMFYKIEEGFMKKFITLFLLVSAGTVGCTAAQKGAAVGGVSGATIGGIIGHQSGHGPTGAAIGGVVGTVGGMLVGEKMEKKFCPTCGRGYTESEKYCPLDGTELKYKQK